MIITRKHARQLISKGRARLVNVIDSETDTTYAVIERLDIPEGRVDHYDAGDAVEETRELDNKYGVDNYHARD